MDMPIHPDIPLASRGRLVFDNLGENSSADAPNDISELTNNPNADLDGSNTAYVIFMIIGIIGYFTIPTVAGWIIQAGGMGSYNRNVNNAAMQGGSWFR